MAATAVLSSCSPHPTPHPDPPIAQAPKPIGVMKRSELPSCFAFISSRGFIMTPCRCSTRRWRRQAEGLHCVWRQTSGYAELIGDLIFRHRVTSRRSKNAIDRTTVVTQLRKLRLDSLDGSISHRAAFINGRGGRVRVVIVRIVIVGVIGQVIPREESFI